MIDAKLPPRLILAATLMVTAGACSHSPTALNAADTVRSEADRWDLTHLYATPADWDQDLAALDAQIGLLPDCKGRLGSGVKSFKRCIDLVFDASKRAGRLGTYAAALGDEDTRIPENLERRQKLQLVGARFSEATSFFSPEILKIGARNIDRYLRADKSLEIYRQGLGDTLRLAPHTLDNKGEALLATLSLGSGTSGAAYNILTGADIPWPTIKIRGESATLDQSAYTKYRSDPDRAVRERVFDSFWAKWKEYERTLGVTLFGNVKEQIANAKVRNYPTARAAALNGSRIPVAVYDALVEQTNANLPTLHRYFKLRGRMLGIQDLRYHDIYPPIVASDRSYPIAEGKRLTLAAAAPLGETYVSGMQEGFNNRWMDVYPQPGKRSGAYMNPGAYDVHPYVLMNYNDDYESVSTLAHEWGHAMHSWLARREQAFPNANYSIFTAEIASTVNEVLLLEHMLSTTQDDDLRLYYLGFALENMRGTFYRQAMFAEFERDIHATVEKGDSLSGASLTKSYCELLKRFHGHDAGVLTIADRECVEWAYIPHFYYNFYVYQYATSISAGSLLADRILNGEKGAREEYLGLLAAGGSDYPYDLLVRAGIDLATPAPYQALVARMNRIMDEIEAILAKRGN